MQPHPRRDAAPGPGFAAAAAALRQRRQRESRAAALPALAHLQVACDGQDVPFKKLMAANRGEIAVRITRAGIELGLTTVRLGSGGGSCGSSGSGCCAVSCWLLCRGCKAPPSACVSGCLLLLLTCRASSSCWHLSHWLLSQAVAQAARCPRVRSYAAIPPCQPLLARQAHSNLRLCSTMVCPPQLAIYSEADRLQPHRFKADESYQVRLHCDRMLCSALL